jgi:hypothetical protein
MTTTPRATAEQAEILRRFDESYQGLMRTDVTNSTISLDETTAIVEELEKTLPAEVQQVLTDEKESTDDYVEYQEFNDWAVNAFAFLVRSWHEVTYSTHSFSSFARSLSDVGNDLSNALSYVDEYDNDYGTWKD